MPSRASHFTYQITYIINNNKIIIINNYEIYVSMLNILSMTLSNIRRQVLSVLSQTNDCLDCTHFTIHQTRTRLQFTSALTGL